MDKGVSRIALSVVVALFSIVPAFLFLELTPIYVAWCIMWAGCFAFLSWGKNLLIRGMLFLMSSIAMGLLGKAYAHAVDAPLMWAIDYVAQVIILVGAGVGANFIAAHFLDSKRRIS